MTIACKVQCERPALLSGWALFYASSVHGHEWSPRKLLTGSVPGLEVRAVCRWLFNSLSGTVLHWDWLLGHSAEHVLQHARPGSASVAILTSESALCPD